MAKFKKKSPQPYVVLRRGQKESDMLYIYDKPQYRPGNGIYADLTEADVLGLTAVLDAKVKTYRLADGIVQTDEGFTPVADKDINDASGKVLTVIFETGQSASVYVPMVLTNKVEDCVTKFGGFKWKDSDGTALKVSRIDYKASMSFGAEKPSA